MAAEIVEDLEAATSILPQGVGVDPYTECKPFQKRLGEVARAATAGGLVMSLGADLATEGIMEGIDASSAT